ncbi:MAG: two pore domain potassium channel family protein [Gammaproteobacteria bacterium]|nr:two pore domain potassium channel family protein [Gammaproteobacteria bacterium]
MDDNNEPRPVRFGFWLAETKFGEFAFSSPERVRVTIFLFVLFTHGLYWATAWWSPWPYLVFTATGLWFSQGVFKPWGTIISQAVEPTWDPAILKITVPFIMFNYVAVFSCLYMLGTVADSDGKAINGMWQHFYFSAVTLSTLGYGNLTPSGIWSEIVATIQAIIGFMGFAVLAGIVASIALKRAGLNENRNQ